MKTVYDIIKAKLTATAIIVLIIAIAIACAPAGQPAQDKDPNATPEPTATPEIEYLVDSSGHRFAVEVHPEREGPIILEQSLESYALNHQATKEANQHSGRSIDPEPRPKVVIFVDSAARVKEIEQYLKQASITVISKSTEPTASWPAGLIANIPITKLLDLADQPGVLRVEEIRKGTPESNNFQDRLPSSKEIHGVPIWHAAGIDGSGVKVGVIDLGFKGITTATTNDSTTAITISGALCFPEGDDNSQPTNEPSDCENGDSHGTEVVQELLQIAPNVQLYISNPRDRVELLQAVNWMTSQTTQVINHSVTYTWDGPGDGTSPYDNPDMTYSPLRSADTAITNGAIWIAAAGNYGNKTWFSRDVMFKGTAVNFNPAGNAVTCNEVRLQSDKQYDFQLRWRNPWPRANLDLNLYLYGTKDRNGNRTEVAKSVDRQRGDIGQYPKEDIRYRANDTGSHCLTIKTTNTMDSHEWLQLQTFNPTGPELVTRPTENPGGIANPAESNNPGLLAVGSSSTSNLPEVKPKSSRGPIPEPHRTGRIAPHLVAASGDRETSFAAPHVAGIAALLIQAIGDNTSYNEPDEIAQYIKELAKIRAEQQGQTTGVVLPNITYPNNKWGHGLAFLLQPAPPSNMVLQRTSGDHDGITLTFNHSQWIATDVRQYIIPLERVCGNERVIQERKFRFTGNTVTFLDLPPDCSYRAYAMRCALPIGEPSRCGKASPYTEYINVPPDPAWPGAPLHFTATPTVSTTSTTQIRLEWDDAAGATSYEVKNQAGTITAATTSELTVDATAGTTHYHQVRSVKGEYQSPWTYWLETTAAPVPATPIPTNPRATHGTISLTWQNVPHTKRYEVQLWDGSTSTMRTLPFRELDRDHLLTNRIITTPLGTLAIIRGLGPRVEYTYRVRAINDTGSSDWSPVQNQITQSIHLLTQTSTLRSTDYIIFTWGPVNGATTEIQQWDGRAGEFKNLPFRESHLNHDYTITADQANGQFRFDGLEPGTPYTYRLRITDDEITTRWFTINTATLGEVPPDAPPMNPTPFPTPTPTPTNTPTPPAQPEIGDPPKTGPTELSAEVFNGHVILSWTPGQNTNYVEQIVRRREAGLRPEDWIDFPIGLNENSFTDPMPQTGVTYIYRIQALKANGIGGESNRVEVPMP